MKESNQAARGVLALSIAGILSKIISVLYVPFLTKILGGVGYGYYAQITEVYLFVYALTTVGAQPAVAKLVSELSAKGYEKEAVKALKISRKFYGTIGCIVAVLMILLAFPLARNIKGLEGVGYGIIALAPCVIATSLLATYRGYMQGKNNMKAIAISQILEQFINVILSLLFAFIFVQSSYELGAAGGQIGTSVGAFFAFVFLIYCYQKREYEDIEISDEEVKRGISNKRILNKLIMYSIPIVMNAGIQNFGGMVDMINVKGRLMAAGFSQELATIYYGDYGLYKTIYGVPMIVITAIATTVLPSISSLRVLNDKKEIRRKIRNAFRLTLVIAIPSAVGLSVISDNIFYALFGHNRNAFLLTCGSYVLVLMAYTQIQNVILQGINKFYYILVTFAVGIVFKIIFNYIFVAIPQINIYGVLFGNTIWYLIPAILNHRLIKRTMKMKLSVVKLFIKPLISSAVMGAVVYFVQKVLGFVYNYVPQSRYTAVGFLIILIPIAGFIYGYLMILMGGIRNEDIQSISPKIIRFLPRFMRVKLR